MLQIIGTLLTVILVLIFTWYFTRKVGQFSTWSKSSRYLKIIDRIAVGQNEALVLVQADQKYLLLGVSAKGIHLLMDMGDTLTLPATEEITTAPSGIDFRAILEQLKKGSDKHG